nr:hypothetical protein [uncultured Holophaga sp.]
MPIYLLSAARTPWGAFGGALRKLSPSRLAAMAVSGAMRRAGCSPGDVDGLVLGQALRYGLGADPAGQVALEAGLGPDCPAWCVDQGALSGFRAVSDVLHALEAGAHACMIATACASSSATPYLLPAARWGHRLGRSTAQDPLLLDLMEPVGTSPGAGQPGGDQTEASRSRHQAARWDLEPCPTRDGDLTQDECPLPSGPDPGLADGAAALLLGSHPPVATPATRILGLNQAAAVTPAEALDRAVRGLLAQAGLGIGAVERLHIDESLINNPQALPSLATEPGIGERINPLGGSLATGQAFGAEGIRLLATLHGDLLATGCNLGLAAMASAEGRSMALLLERIPA